MSSAQFRIIAAFLVGAAGVLSVATLTRDHDWGGDFAGYIMQAASIVDGTTGDLIDATRLTMDQSTRRFGPVTFGWGFPLLLAPAYAHFGMDILALKSVGVCSLLLFLVLLCREFRNYHTPGWLLILVGLFALNPLFIAFPNFILSDLPFLAVSTFTVLFIGRVLVDPQPPVSPGRASLLLGFFVAIAFMVRPNGILLLPTIAAAQLVRVLRHRRRTLHSTDGSAVDGLRPNVSVARLSPRTRAPGVRWVPFVLPYVGFLSLVLITRILLPDGGGYPIHPHDLSLESLLQSMLLHFLLPYRFFVGSPFPLLVWLATIPLALRGLMLRYRTDYHIVVYSVFTYLLYTVRPFLDPVPSFQGLRYLFPILPFYISFAITGLASLAVDKSGVQRRLIRALSVATPLLLIAILGGQSLRGAWMNTGHRRQSIAGPFSEAASEMFAFLRQTTDSQAIIVFFKPRVIENDDRAPFTDD